MGVYSQETPLKPVFLIRCDNSPVVGDLQHNVASEPNRNTTLFLPLTKAMKEQFNIYDCRLATR